MTSVRRSTSLVRSRGGSGAGGEAATGWEGLAEPGGITDAGCPCFTGTRRREVDRRTLVIGQGISLSGEVTSCDRLVVEGGIKEKLHNCQNVMISETGVFEGQASTENADVRGRFEGELAVRKRLLIRAGGHVSGTITYGEIEIEAGGKISGAIQVDERPKGLGIKRP